MVLDESRNLDQDLDSSKKVKNQHMTMKKCHMQDNCTTKGNNFKTLMICVGVGVSVCMCMFYKYGRFLSSMIL